VLVPNPGYPAYSAAANLAGAEPVFYDLTEENRWLPEAAALQKTDLSGVKMMWINYPHMPSGAVATIADFRKVADFAHQQQILLCHDNPYSLILNPQPLSVFNSGEVFDGCLELNSLSKSHNMAGWRVGMVIGGGEYLDAILKVKSNLDSGMFLPLQKAAVQALQNSPEWHQRQNREYLRRREGVFELLDNLNCSYKKESAGMFAWAKAPDGVGDVEMFTDELLYSAGVFVTPGRIFGSNGEGYIRVSLCASEERIQQAIKRIKDMVLQMNKEASDKFASELK
jgi:aspartate/methionine/tyrosine aminotransferase